MSRIFYDHLVLLSEVDVFIKKTATTTDERQELWQIVDEIINHRIMASILDFLPREHHEEFLEKFMQAPYDENLIVYINNKTNKDIESFIKDEVKKLESEILQELKEKK